MQNARSPNWRRCALFTTSRDSDDDRNVLIAYIVELEQIGEVAS